MTETNLIHVPNELTKHEGFYAAIYCSYGFDPAFFEEVILHSLRNKKCLHHVIFLDSARYRDTIDHLRGNVNWVGRRYILVPVELPPFRSFHPKIILLLGPDHGRLMLGSGNLTFTGLGQNHEVYSCLDLSADQPELLSIFREVWSFIRSLQSRWGHASLVEEILRKTEHVAYWVHGDTEKPTNVDHPSIRFVSNLDESILDHLESWVSGQVERLIVFSPFLDNRAVALSELHERFRPNRLQVVVQNDRTVGEVNALNNLIDTGIPLQFFEFNNDESRYLHAKIMYFETREKVYVLTGSPNCTYGGLLSVGNNVGNIETALLQRTGNDSHFEYLLRSHLQPEHQISLDDLTLRQTQVPTVETTDVDGQTPSPWVRLFEVSIEGSKLKIDFEIRQDIQPHIDALYLQFLSIPPYFLPINESKEGKHILEISIGDELDSFLKPLMPVPVTIIGRQSDNQIIELHANELWVNFVDEIHLAARQTRYAAGRATDVFANMLAESDNDWRDLYYEIKRLVNLEVRKVAGKPARDATTSKRTNSRSKPEEQDTNITLGDEDINLGLDEEEVTAAAVSRESEFQAFFDYIRQHLPGRSTIFGEPTSPKKNSKENTRIPRKWSPQQHLRVRFLNLVRKFVESLNNPEYMRQVPIPDLLAYYVVFQRIVRLLYTHGAIDSGLYVDLVLDINEGVFGESLSVPPANSPLLRRHLRHAWADEWIGTDAMTYAIASLKMVRKETRVENDSSLSDRLIIQSRRIRVCLHVLVNFDLLQHLLETPDDLHVIAEVYNLDIDDLTLIAGSFFEQDMGKTAIELEQWTRKLSIAINDALKDRHVNLLYQANVDYRRALFELYRRQQSAVDQIRTLKRLVYWTHRAGDEAGSHEWGRRLVDLRILQGADSEAVDVLYHQANRLFIDQNYVEALSFAKQALRLAERLNYLAGAKKCRRLLSYIETMTRT